MKTAVPTKPWYREPWPYLLAAGPLIVVIAGLYTWKLAAGTSDGLVAEDYYKQGLSAGQTVARSERAQLLGVTAHLLFRADRLTVRLNADAGFVAPPSLRVTLSHPTRAGLDQSFDLPQVGEDYVVERRLPDSGNWLVLVEDAGQTWRLLGNVLLPSTGAATIGRDPTPQPRLAPGEAGRQAADGA